MFYVILGGGIAAAVIATRTRHTDLRAVATIAAIIIALCCLLFPQSW
ncbi:hypothetical protein [Streptomyces sp. NBC_00670]|jgi:hypothetical protein|nr:hypothetical protein [Streptomyces sp. NBC_00670]